MTIAQFNNRNPFSAHNKQVHNIKTAGGPKRFTRRKIARPTATYTPRCSGAGDRPRGRVAVENVWKKATIGWWNYDLHTTAQRFSSDMVVDDMKYSGKNPSPWTSGAEYVPHGVQTLGDRVHVAKTSTKQGLRDDLLKREEIFWDRSSTPTKAYQAQLDAQQYAEAVDRELAKPCSHSQPSAEQRMWDNIRAGVSNGKAKRKGGA